MRIALFVLVVVLLVLAFSACNAALGDIFGGGDNIAHAAEIETGSAYILPPGFYAVPANCWLKATAPTSGMWQPGVVKAWGGPHFGSSCGAKVAYYKNGGLYVFVYTGILEKCNQDVCINNGDGWTTISAKSGVFLAKARMFNYLVP